MITKVCFTISLFILTFSASVAHAQCANGLAPIRDGAMLQHLQEGSFIAFKKDVEVPTFKNSKDISQTITLYIDARSFPRYFPKGKHYKIEKSSDYMLGTSQFEVYYNPNEGPTVGDLRALVGDTIELCAQISAAKPI